MEWDNNMKWSVRKRADKKAIKCAMLYNSPHDFERPSLETFDMTIAGTTKRHISFPIKVYTELGESKCMSI